MSKARARPEALIGRGLSAAAASSAWRLPPHRPPIGIDGLSWARSPSVTAPPDELARLRLLHDLGLAFAARIELDELIPLVIGKCREVLDAEGASVLLLDDTGTQLSFPYVAEDDAADTPRLLPLRFP